MMNRYRAAAAIVTAVLAVFVIASLSSRGLRSTNADTAEVEKVAVMKRVQAGGFAQPHGLGAAYAPVASARAPSNSALQIARTGRLSLFVTNIDAAVRAVSQLARRDGGDVMSLQSGSDGGQSAPSAQVQIRVPASLFDAAMNAAGSTGTVRSRSVSAEDLTSDMTDSGARLRNLKRTELDILSIMDRSGSVSQVLAAENQLSDVRGQIESLESQLREMRGRVAYATIDIAMQLEAPPRAPTASVASQLSVAWSSALAAVQATLIGIAATALWIAAFLPLVIACVVALYLAFVAFRRFQASRASA